MVEVPILPTESMVSYWNISNHACTKWHHYNEDENTNITHTLAPVPHGKMPTESESACTTRQNITISIATLVPPGKIQKTMGGHTHHVVI